MSAPDRTHCRVCDRPRATQDDFDKIAPGDGAHLCWGAWDEGACYSARVDWYERAMAARAARDAATQAFDDLVAQVWTVATGSTHEGPASVDALLNAVLDLRNARDAAALPVGHVAVDRALYEAACRLASDVPRLQREVVAARREGAEAMREACAARAKDHAAALMDEATGATRRGRSDVANSFSVAASAAGSIATAIRALPLPGGEP